MHLSSREPGVSHPSGPGNTPWSRCYTATHGYGSRRSGMADERIIRQGPFPAGVELDRRKPEPGDGLDSARLGVRSRVEGTRSLDRNLVTGWHPLGVGRFPPTPKPLGPEQRRIRNS